MTLILTPDQTTFLQGPVSINVGAVGRDGWPCVCRAHGLSVSRGRDYVTVILSETYGRAVLDAIGDGSGVSVVASRPATHATLQFKASTASCAKTGTAQQALASRCVAVFGDELVNLGYGDSLRVALTQLMQTESLVALRVVPEILFDQTPGPKAGQVLARA